MKILVFSSDGVGGTEKTATQYAVGLAGKGHEVLFTCPLGGPRAQYLTQGGVLLVGNVGDEATLRKLLLAEQPDVIHQHVPGYPTGNPIYAVLAGYPGRKPCLVETNVFGRLEEPLSDLHVQSRFFVSMASGTQAFLRAGIPLEEAGTLRNSVLYNPSFSRQPQTPAARQPFRARLGIAENEILVLRIGRPGAKWRTWDCEAFALARKEQPRLKLLLMEPPEFVKRNIRSGRYGEGIVVLPETSDFEWLGALYDSADLMLHASAYGESFGCTLSEAMEAGLPLIVRSTPWGDNAQVELVQHGETGYVCCSVPGMAQALVELANDGALRKTLGEAGRARIKALCDFDQEVAFLEESLRALVDGSPAPLREQRSRQWLEFACNFRQREQQTLEKERGLFWPRVGGATYAAYRCSRTQLGRWLGRLKGA